MTSATTSASRAAPTAASTIRTFMRCIGRCTPGVSRNRICPSGRFFAPRMRVRVVCGLSETMARCAPTSRLSSVDLPALGRPRSDDEAGRMVYSSPSARQPPHADLQHPPALGLEDFDVEAVLEHVLATAGTRPRRLSR